jgi:hypothetical protein
MIVANHEESTKTLTTMIQAGKCITGIRSEIMAMYARADGREEETETMSIEEGLSLAHERSPSDEDEEDKPATDNAGNEVQPTKLPR